MTGGPMVRVETIDSAAAFEGLAGAWTERRHDLSSRPASTMAMVHS